MSLAEPNEFLPFEEPTNSEFIALIADKLQLQLKGAGAANYEKETRLTDSG